MHQNNILTYSCDFAMLTGTTRLGQLLQKYGKEFPDRAIYRELKPENCPFYVKGERAKMKFNNR